jgi:hypothetical protein
VPQAPICGFLRFDQTSDCSLLAKRIIIQDKTNRHYTLKEIMYSILLMKASIEPEKIVINSQSIKTLVEWVINRFV